MRLHRQRGAGWWRSCNWPNCGRSCCTSLRQPITLRRERRRC